MATITLGGNADSSIQNGQFKDGLDVKMDYSKGGNPQKTILRMHKNVCMADFTIGANTFVLVVIIDCKLEQLIGPDDTPLIIDRVSYNYLSQRGGIQGFKQITMNCKIASDIYFRSYFKPSRKRDHLSKQRFLSMQRVFH